MLENFVYSKYATLTGLLLENTRAHRTMAKSINFQFNGMHCMLVYSAYCRGKSVHITNARKSYRCSVQLVCHSKRFSILIRLYYNITYVFKHRKPHVKKTEIGPFWVLAILCAASNTMFTIIPLLYYTYTYLI